MRLRIGDLSIFSRLALLLLAASVAAQSGSPNQTQSPAQSGKAATPVQNQAQSPDDKEVKITAREAEELFHSVDEILEFDSTETGLPVKRSVKRKLTSREEVMKFLTGHMKDEDTRRFQRSELVLKKFGLIPRGYDLETALLALLQEQIAGYYDPKTKTVNLLDWISPSEQEPVLAHELTHALQDQAVNMDKFMKKGDRDLAELKKPPTAEDIENDEIDDAREAIIEGQAEAVMLDFALKPVGRSIADSPELVSAMESEMMNGNADSTVFKSAPLYLRESLTFPYNYGLKFEIRMMEVGGREQAFAKVLANPPHTSRQIMQPETYLAGEKLAPMPVVDFARDFKNYERFDVGAVGEDDTATLLEQYAGKEISERLYRDWRGGYYYAVRPKNSSSAPLGVMYLSRWSSAEKAAEFASIYARAICQRYKQAKELTPPADSAKPSADKAEVRINLLKGRHEWMTEEGSIVMNVQGDMLLVSESLDADLTQQLEKELFPAPSSKN